MGVAHNPPPSLSIHAQCFWTFTPTERRVMEHALDMLLKPEPKTTQTFRVARMLRDALNELSEQD